MALEWRHSPGESHLYLGLDLHANVWLDEDETLWRWEATLPEDVMNVDLGGWHGVASTEEAAQEAAEAYLRHYGVPVS